MPGSTETDRPGAPPVSPPSSVKVSSSTEQASLRYHAAAHATGIRRPIAKDPTTRDRMAREHLPLVTRLCERYRYSGVAMEDLVQVGSLGLLKAVDKFDPQRGTKLSTFAIPVIMGEIKNYFRDHGWAVKLPRKLQQQKLAVTKAVEELNQVVGRSPTISEIAAATGFSEDVVHDTFEAGRYGNVLSLEARRERSDSGDSTSAIDNIGSDDPTFDQLTDRIDLTNTLGCLSERETTIISLKFFSGLSQAEIGGRMGISQMHVSRLQRHALEKLRVGLVGAA